MLKDFTTQATKLLGLKCHLTHGITLCVERTLHGQCLQGMVQRMFCILQVAVEGARRSAVHHFRHRRHVIVKGGEYFAVAPANGQVGVFGLGALGELENGVAVLVELLGNLTKQL